MTLLKQVLSKKKKYDIKKINRLAKFNPDKKITTNFYNVTDKIVTLIENVT